MVVTALGFTTLLGYGSSYYLVAILAVPISTDTGWSLPWVVSGLTVGLLTGAIAAPTIGRAVDRHGGRPVLASGSVLLAVGLLGLGCAGNLATYLLAWCVVGLGMGAGLYDAAFAALGGWYGAKARSPITVVTLFGGLASTLCWPLSAYLVETVGWRPTCFVYAALHALVALPIHASLLPAASRDRIPSAEHVTGPPTARGSPRFFFVAAAFTLAATITSIVSVHLLTMLQSRGHSLAASVAIGALLGPSQIIGRGVELAVGKNAAPDRFDTHFGSADGCGGCSIDAGPWGSSPSRCDLCDRSGRQLRGQGTLPLAVFGPRDYGTLIGRLALPSQIAQALAPLVATILLSHAGTDTLLWTLVALSAVHVGVIIALIAASRTSWSPEGRVIR